MFRGVGAGEMSVCMCTQVTFDDHHDNRRTKSLLFFAFITRITKREDRSEVLGQETEGKSNNIQPEKAETNALCDCFGG